MNILSWGKRIFFGLIITILLLLIVGIIFEQAFRARDAQVWPRHGEIVEIEGRKMHYVKKGEGGPTVVFEAGLDLSGHLSWAGLQEALSKKTTTLSYDRAGIQWSHPDEQLKTATSISKDLHAVLEKTGCPKPYILVGHSLAGATMRPFMTQHRADLAGVVWVDVSHPEQFERMPPEMAAQGPSEGQTRTASGFGLLRLMGGDPLPGTQPADSINQIMHAWTHKSLEGVFAEFRSLDTIMAEAALHVDYDSLPLTVLTGTHPERFSSTPSSEVAAEMESLWPTLQKELLTLSSQSRHVLVPEAGHYIQLEHPEAVLAEIERMLAQSRTPAVSDSLDSP
ncbi:MAG: alpha/beta hydrolase [Bacteroidota bacterium]